MKQDNFNGDAAPESTKKSHDILREAHRHCSFPHRSSRKGFDLRRCLKFTSDGANVVPKAVDQVPRWVCFHSYL